MEFREIALRLLQAWQDDTSVYESGGPQDIKDAQRTWDEIEDMIFGNDWPGLLAYLRVNSLGTGER